MVTTSALGLLLRPERSKAKKTKVAPLVASAAQLSARLLA